MWKLKEILYMNIREVFSNTQAGFVVSHVWFAICVILGLANCAG